MSSRRPLAAIAADPMMIGGRFFSGTVLDSEFFVPVLELDGVSHLWPISDV